MPADSDELAIIVTAHTQQVISGLEKVEGAIGRVAQESAKTNTAVSGATSAFGGMVGGGMRLIGVLGGVAAAVAFIAKGLSSSAIKEQGEIQFTTLLGSADAAKERMVELATFANNTPFSNEQVVNMSKTLQAMTSGALASGDGLRLVGDTAAALNPDELERFSLHIGRMYSQMQSGQAFGESLKELQELGAISGPVAAQLREVSESGQVNAETWKIVEKELNKNKGAMEALAGTAGGAFSTLLGSWNDVLADAFRPLTDALIPIMVDLTGGLEAMRPKLVAISEKVAQAIGYVVSAVKFVFSAFQSGDLGALVTTSLLFAGATFVNYLLGGFKLLFDSLGPALMGLFGTLVSPQFWVGVLNVFASIGSIIQGVGLLFIGMVLEAASGWYGIIAGGMVTAGQVLMSAATLAGTAFFGFILDAAEELIAVGQKLQLPGMDALLGHVQAARESTEGLGKAAADMLSDIPGAFEKNKEAATSLFADMGEGAQELGKELISTGMEQGQTGGAALGGAVAENFGKAFEGVSFSPDDMFDTGSMKDELKDMVGKHWQPPLDKMKDETKKNADETGGAISKAVDPSVVADSLSKIGGGGNIFAAAAEASGGGVGTVGGLSSSGLTLGAAEGSRGLSGGGAVGGSLGESLLQSIDSKLSDIIALMGNGSSGGGGGLVVELS